MIVKSPFPDISTPETSLTLFMLDDLVEFVADRVVPQKRIRAIETVDEIPQSPSGKILRRVLFERERERTSS